MIIEENVRKLIDSTQKRYEQICLRTCKNNIERAEKDRALAMCEARIQAWEAVLDDDYVLFNHYIRESIR